MKYVRLSLSHDPDVRHPMHQFVVDHGGFSVSRLVSTSPTVEGVRTALFHVEGAPLADYEDALVATDSVRDYAISACPDDSFYLYTRDALSEDGQTLADAFARVGLVLLYPIEYHADGSVRFTGGQGEFPGA